ncbi:MAG: SEL1-like repeat protein [Alphaproteobacteria bacterium]|nr:SEL1-like repeat protein [Alphaproteobacteria bacterium]
MKQQVIYTFIGSLFLNFTALASSSSNYLQEHYERIPQLIQATQPGNVSTINPSSNQQKEDRDPSQLRLNFLTYSDFPDELGFHCLTFMQEEELLALRGVNKAYQELIKRYLDARAFRLRLEPEAMFDYMKDVMKYPPVYRWVMKGATGLYYKDKFLEEDIRQARKYLRKVSQYSTTHPWEKVEASEELMRKVKLIFEKVHLHYLNQELEDNSQNLLIKCRHAEVLYFHSALTEQNLKEYYQKEALFRVENILSTFNNHLTPSASPQELLKLINASTSLNERTIGYQAIFLKGLLCELSKDEKKQKLSEILYKALAEEKTIEPDLKKWAVKSQTQLGLLYRYARGVTQDYTEALKWFNKAATEEDPLAQKELGEMYYTSQGTAKKEFEAWELFEKAASNGYRDGAMFTTLSLIYENGIKKGRKDKRLAPDLFKSKLYLQRALDEGYGPAFSSSVKKPHLNQNYNRAIQLAEKAIRKGYADKEMLDILVSMYEKNQVVRQKFDNSIPIIKFIAEQWYRKAAGQGDALAQYNLGSIYLNRKGIPKEEISRAEEFASFWWRKAAESGYAVAQYKLGWMYDNRKGIPEAEKEQADELAVSWWRKAAGQREAIAQNYLGWMYDNRKGIPEAEKEQADELAVIWYRKAADQGYVHAQYNLGRMYVNRKGIPAEEIERADEIAVAWYRKAAEQGYVHAQYKLGWMYDNRIGIPAEEIERADELAVAWYRKAAEQGYAVAQVNLGFMYFHGQGVNQDYTEASEWFNKAKDQNQPLAFYLLGYMHHKGLGIAFNPDQSQEYFQKNYKLFTETEEHQRSYAQATLGNMFRYGYGVEQNFQKAIEWYQKAVDQNNYYYANAMLGRMYKKGEGIPQDLSKAFALIHKAAEEKNSEGLYNLALMYRDGEGIGQDDQKAVEFLQLAAQRKLGPAMYTLGWMYQEGRGINQDSEQAHYWMQEGEKRDYADALYSIGRMYEYGLTVEQDLAKAIEWYKKAADLHYDPARAKLKQLTQSDS